MRKRTPQGTPPACRRLNLEGLEDRSLLSAAHQALSQAFFSPPHALTAHPRSEGAEGHNNGHGNGIGQTVKEWTHEGIHGRELAARIHQLQDSREGRDDHHPNSSGNNPGRGNSKGDDPAVGDTGGEDSAGGQSPGAVPPGTPPPVSAPETPPVQTPAGRPVDRGGRPPSSVPSAAAEDPSVNPNAAVVNLPSELRYNGVLLVSALAISSVPLPQVSRTAGGTQAEEAAAGEGGAGRGATALGPIGAGLNGVLTAAAPVVPALLEFVPNAEGEIADLLPSLTFAIAEPHSVLVQLVDWSSSEGVRDWLPWLSGAVLATAALELARRQVRRSGKRNPALPPCEFSEAGWPAQDSP